MAPGRYFSGISAGFGKEGAEGLLEFDWVLRMIKPGHPVDKSEPVGPLPIDGLHVEAARVKMPIAIDRLVISSFQTRQGDGRLYPLAAADSRQAHENPARSRHSNAAGPAAIYMQASTCA
jgi:hypothetical protein